MALQDFRSGLQRGRHALCGHFQLVEYVGAYSASAHPAAGVEAGHAHSALRQLIGQDVQGHTVTDAMTRFEVAKYDRGAGGYDVLGSPPMCA